MVAGFDDESEYAIVSKVIPTPETDGGEVEVILSGISEEVTEIELCVINRLRKRYEDLVNQPSTIVNDVLRVKPRNAKESILHQILNTNISSSWGIDHSQMVTSSNILTLIDNWIDDGAQE